MVPHYGRHTWDAQRKKTPAPREGFYVGPGTGCSGGFWEVTLQLSVGLPEAAGAFPELPRSNTNKPVHQR